jgi:hypothetical protein
MVWKSRHDEMVGWFLAQRKLCYLYVLLVHEFNSKNEIQVSILLGRIP